MLFEFRQEADYDLDEDITMEDAEMLINKANEMYQLTKAYFHELTSNSR